MILQYYTYLCSSSRVKVRPPRENGDAGSPAPLPILQIRPKERQAAIQNAVDLDLQRSRDSKWEDASDVSTLLLFHGWLLIFVTESVPRVTRAVRLPSLQIYTVSAHFRASHSCRRRGSPTEVPFCSPPSRSRSRSHAA